MSDSVRDRYKRVLHLLTVNQRREFRARFAKESQRPPTGDYFKSLAHIHAAATLAMARAEYRAPGIASTVSTGLRESRQEKSYT